MVMNNSIEKKVAGALFGYAVGDALGVGTEFMDKREIKRRYPDGVHEYSQIVRDAHRSQWERGQWTNDTFYLLMLIDSICECDAISTKDLAHRLHEWYLTNPDDVTQEMRWVISQPDFAEAPYSTARRVWDEMKNHTSPSDCLGRALVTGLWNENVVDHAIDIVRFTHPTTRCETSSAIIAKMANSLMWKNREASFDELLLIAHHYNVDVIPYLEIARDGKIDDLQLDNPANFWFVRKAMAAALWCVWHCDTPEEGLLKVVNQGGDSGINSSLATGLLGLKFGIEAIPERYITALKQKDKVQAAVDKYSAVLTQRFGPK